MTVEGYVVVSGIGHAFPRARSWALEGISFSVAKGQALAIVGRSGCGKSTLLQILAGLLPPLRGVVHIGGQAVSGPSARWNMMFQAPSLLPWMNVEQNIGLGLRYAGLAQREIRRRVAELIGLVRLEDVVRSYPQQLSGGQQQRVALARSLATRPEILLLDEPFSALDPFNRASLQAEVRAIARRLGLTLLIVTHEINEAVLMADRALVLAARPGRIFRKVEIALPAERTPETPGFTQCRGELFAALAAASAQPPVGAANGGGGRSPWRGWLPAILRSEGMCHG